MATRVERIEALAPRQALDIVQYMSSWLDARRTNMQELTTEQQTEGLNKLFREFGHVPLPLSTEAAPDEQAAGRAARWVLRLLADSGDDVLLGELDHWLDGPPEAGTLVLAELIVVPIILTACIVVLQTSFQWTYNKDGKWVVQGTRRGLGGKDLNKVLAGIYDALKHLT